MTFACASTIPVRVRERQLLGRSTRRQEASCPGRWTAGRGGHVAEAEPAPLMSACGLGGCLVLHPNYLEIRHFGVLYILVEFLSFHVPRLNVKILRTPDHGHRDRAANPASRLPGHLLCRRTGCERRLPAPRLRAQCADDALHGEPRLLQHPCPIRTRYSLRDASRLKKRDASRKGMRRGRQSGGASVPRSGPIGSARPPVLRSRICERTHGLRGSQFAGTLMSSSGSGRSTTACSIHTGSARLSSPSRTFCSSCRRGGGGGGLARATCR